MSASIIRSIRNALRVGPKDYFKQLNAISDTKYGTLVGVDSYGNKYFENDKEDEIYIRTRWVQYKVGYGDVSQVEPAWHFWLAHGVGVPPSKTAPEHKSVRAYPVSEVYENLSGTPGAYVCYNTTKPKITAWEPQVASRA